MIIYIVRSKPIFHSLFDITVGISLCNTVALIVKLFTLAESYGHLNSRALEVERKGNESIALS